MLQPPLPHQWYRMTILTQSSAASVNKLKCILFYTYIFIFRRKCAAIHLYTVRYCLYTNVKGNSSHCSFVFIWCHFAEWAYVKSEGDCCSKAAFHTISSPSCSCFRVGQHWAISFIGHCIKNYTLSRAVHENWWTMQLARIFKIGYSIFGKVMIDPHSQL